MNQFSFKDSGRCNSQQGLTHHQKKTLRKVPRKGLSKVFRIPLHVWIKKNTAFLVQSILKGSSIFRIHSTNPGDWPYHIRHLAARRKVSKDPFLRHTERPWHPQILLCFSWWKTITTYNNSKMATPWSNECPLSQCIQQYINGQLPAAHADWWI